MTESDLDARMALATDAVRAAGRLALDYFIRREALAIERKGLQDLVSEADREVERVIRDRLGAAFPEDGILGEEHGGELHPHLWVIDPIDGTANFLRGLPYWCVVLAYAVDNEPVLALTYDAVHDELFAARRGRGATRNGVPIRVAGRGPAEACVGLSYSFKTEAGAYERLIERLLAHRLDHRRMGSSALSLCHLADGRLDAAAAPSCNSWDVLAGLLLVQEAGGLVTPYARGSSLLERRAIAAASPEIAELVGEITELELEPGVRR
jgi:myo-inositol-1(or 4)-monophosphatase